MMGVAAVASGFSVWRSQKAREQPSFLSVLLFSD